MEIQPTTTGQTAGVLTSNILGVNIINIIYVIQKVARPSLYSFLAYYLQVRFRDKLPEGFQWGGAFKIVYIAVIYITVL